MVKQQHPPRYSLGVGGSHNQNKGSIEPTSASNIPYHPPYPIRESLTSMIPLQHTSSESGHHHDDARMPSSNPSMVTCWIQQLPPNVVNECKLSILANLVLSANTPKLIPIPIMESMKDERQLPKDDRLQELSEDVLGKEAHRATCLCHLSSQHITSSAHSENTTYPSDFDHWLGRTEPCPYHDIIVGRGGRSNHHVGNRIWRKQVMKHRPMYQEMPQKQRKDKNDFSTSLVDNFFDSGMQFIRFHTPTGQYYVIRKEQAIKKTSQALREKKSYQWMPN